MRTNMAVLTLMAVVSFGCGGIDPCTVEQTLCLANGGTWIPEGECGRCEFPEPPPPDPCDECAPDETCMDGKCVPVEPPPPPPPPPEPQCPTFTDRGGNLRCQSDACDCFCGEDWVKCEPPPSDFPGPTAAELSTAGKRVQILPSQEGRRAFGATPRGEFGRDYYCLEAVAWPEACAEGRKFGPVAPDGHPKRAEWEAAFMSQPCPRFTAESSAHVSFDPFIVRNGVNQNHPRNVRVCGQAPDHADPSWVKDANGYVQSGIWSWATFHCTPGVPCRVCAEAKHGVGRACKSFVEP